MASVNKINLCDDTQTKLAGATLTCKTVLLPAYADDVLLVTKCGLSGQVEATLQHSPDGVRWTNCQVKKIESSSGTASFGNEWHLDLIPKASEVENKHLLQYSNFGGVTDQDITTAFMAHDKPFNLSMWLKSTKTPTTYSPQLYINTKYKFAHKGAASHSNNVGGLASNQGNMTNWDSTAGDFINAGSGWTISMWLNFDLKANVNNNLEVNTGNGLNNGDSSLNYITGSNMWHLNGGWSSQQGLMVDSNGYLCYMYRWYSGGYKNIRVPLADLNSTTNGGTNYQDQTWRHFCVVYDGDYHTASSIDSWKVYINGVAMSKPDGFLSTTGETGLPTFNLRIGSNNSSGFGSLAHMDGISMWNIGFSAADVTEMYNDGGLVPAENHSKFSATNCWFATNFQDANDAFDASGYSSAYSLGNNSVVDQSGNGNHLTPTDQWAMNPTEGTHPTSGTGSGIYSASAVASQAAYGPILFRCGGKTVEDSGKIKSFFNNPAPNSGATSHMIEIPGIAADGTAGATQIVGNTKDWTASFWYKGTDTNGGTIFALGNNANLMNDKGLEFYSTSSAHGSLVIKVGNGNGGYYDFYSSYGATYAICDGDWHHVVLTYKGVASDGNTYQLDAHATSESTPGFSVYIDGAHQVLKTANSSDTSHTSPFGDSAADVYKAICNWIGRRGAIGWGAQHGEFTDLAIFNEMKTAAQILAMYNSGSPTDLTVDSSCVSLLRADDMTTATSLSDGTVIANSSTHADASTYVATWDHGGAGGVGTLDVVDLTASDSIYRAPVAANNFGNGITISITDKVKTDGTWNTSGGENPHLLLSFDGFENDAAQWVAWKCSQTDIDPLLSETTPANLLDGTWHNLILSYRGVTSAGDSAAFGRGGVGGHDSSHWHLGWNGLKTDHLNSYHGVDAAKSAANGQDVTLAMQDYHLKNVSGTYVRTSFFASGFLEDSVDSEYAFQGQIDETSFDSSTWWRNPAPEQGTFCDCPLEVVYGNNDQRLTLPAGTANDNYAFTLLSLAPGKPHDLLDPLSVNTDPINNQKAYIDPYPTGQYRCSDGIGSHTTKATCDANHSIHSSPKGNGDGTAGNTNWIGANENFPGGIEWYYRWGDIATDCKVCVNDARAFTLGVSAGEPAVAETVTDRSAAIKGTLSVGDLKASGTSNGGSAETIYVEGSSGGGGTTITYEDLVNDCVLAGDNVITHLNIPHLHHLRLVYTGSSACNAGDCVGDLFYSTRRK